MPTSNNLTTIDSTPKNELFSWIPFFEEMAEKLLQYENRQEELIQMLKDIGITSGLSDKDENGDIKLTEIDPFSFFCFFTKYKDKNRTQLLSKIKPLLNIKTNAPLQFGGVPNTEPRNVKLFSYKSKRTSQDVPLLWKVFKRALHQKIDNELFTKILKINGVGNARITQNLFYVKPSLYLPIDSQTSPLLESKNITTDFNTFSEYQAILEEVKERFEVPFYELSYEAWIRNQEKPDKIAASSISQKKIERRFWKFSPGEGAYMWDEFYRRSIMAIDFSNLDLGDISRFKSYIEMTVEALNKGKIKSKNSNQTGNLYDFKDASVGDVVFANHGTKKVIGIGIIMSEYQYHEGETFPHKRYIDWITNKKLDFLSVEVEGYTNLFRTDTFSTTKLHRYIIKAYLETYPELTELFEKHDLIKPSSILQEPNSPIYKPLKLPAPKKTDTDLNIILYGPPGTGKTYETIDLAAKIVGFDTGNHQQNLAIFNQLLGNQIEFITFHQSFAYEDFVEGIKPQTVSNKNGDKTVTYDIEEGVFMRIVKRAMKNTGTQESQEQTEFERVFELLKGEWEASDNNEVEIPMQRVSFHITDITKTYIAFRKASGGTAHTLTINTLRKIYYKKMDFNSGLATYYNPLVKYLKRKVQKLPKQNKSQAQNYVLIIDEINRGNISNIFGELITLIEPDKRIGGTHPLSVTLPYSKSDFSIPSNLYIIGTMNTADRSVEALDTALRRRFSFVPKYPDAVLLQSLIEQFEGELNIEELLTTINNRIEKLLNIDYGIGHSYFLVLESAKEPLKAIRLIFDQKILPLLQEYFYGDYEKIGMILGSGFVIPKYKHSNEVFQFGKGFTNAQYDFEEKTVYKFTKSSTWTIETFRSIYEN